MGEVEAEVFQLAIDVVEAEAVGDGRVDFQGFVRNALLLRGLHRFQRAHVVQPVGQLDQDHAHIARHGEQHLAEIFCLGMGLRLEFDLVQLGNAVYQFGDLFAELRADFLAGGCCVLHHVMQQRGHDGLGVKAPFGQDGGDCERVGNVGFAAFAHLPMMGCFGNAKSFLDLGNVLRLEVGGERFGELGRVGHGG